VGAALAAAACSADERVDDSSVDAMAGPSDAAVTSAVDASDARAQPTSDAPHDAAGHDAADHDAADHDAADHDAADHDAADHDAADHDAAPDAHDAAPLVRDITFYVVADTHADPVPEYDLRAQARAINAVSQGGVWPASIDGTDTHFKGGAIAPPRGVVFVGDLTGWGTAPTEIPMFQHYFQKGTSSESIAFDAYLGLGNHDIDTADRDQATADAYRATYWQFIDAHHLGASALVPVGRFDAPTHNYSWSWDDAHFVQTHRFCGDSAYGLPSSRTFLSQDLATVGDDHPVFLFHHYGMDAFGTQDRWWTQADRDAYRAILKGHAISAIFVGHSHAAFQYSWEGIRVFQVNNAKAENGTGNNDGNGSFAIVRITNDSLDVVTCRWLDDQGHYELVAPFFNGPANPGLAP
jgi:cytolysin (calcineurin-like family phosphatase)